MWFAKPKVAVAARGGRVLEVPSTWHNFRVKRVGRREAAASHGRPASSAIRRVQPGPPYFREVFKWRLPDSLGMDVQQVPDVGVRYDQQDSFRQQGWNLGLRARTRL